MLIGLYLVLALEARELRRAVWVGVLCGSLLAAYIAILALPGLRDFFELTRSGRPPSSPCSSGAGLAVGFLWLTDDRFVPLRGTCAFGT